MQQGRGRYLLRAAAHLVPGRGERQGFREKLLARAPLTGRAHDEPTRQPQVARHALNQIVEPLALGRILDPARDTDLRMIRQVHKETAGKRHE